MGEYHGWNDLRRDIETAAHDAGNPVTTNGSDGNDNRSIKCAECNRLARLAAMDVTAKNPFREMSLVHNQKK